MKKYFLYYAGFNHRTQEEQIGVATSSNLSEWKYSASHPQIPLASQGTHDTQQTSNPCVLKHEGVYRMWFQGKSDKGLLSICYAESADGLVWNVDSRPVLTPEVTERPGFRDGFQHPHVVFDTEAHLFKMWFVLYKDGLTSIVYSESSDGRQWGTHSATSMQSRNPQLKYFYPFVMRESHHYRMWFTERVNGRWQISVATSIDGLAWSLYEANPVICPAFGRWGVFIWEAIAKLIGWSSLRPIHGIGSPFVWKEGSTYMLIGHEVGPRGKLYIPLYVSSDGLSWKKTRNNILPKTTSEWNSFFQADPFLYVEE